MKMLNRKQVIQGRGLVDEKKDGFMLFMLLETTGKREGLLRSIGKENNSKSDETWRKRRDNNTVKCSLHASL